MAEHAGLRLGDAVRAGGAQGTGYYLDSSDASRSSPVEEEEEEEVEGSEEVSAAAATEPLKETSLEDVTQLLNDLDELGDTCAGGQADMMPFLPGLVVQGMGHISLPLNEVQAKMLAATAEWAPHGKGLKTVVDISVRNTLQIAPHRVSFSDMWQTQLQKLVLKVAEELGVPPRSVKAELYKLLLYETGGHFKPHRDTEKAQGMFATLVVQLPSRFTGGEMRIRHAGKQRIFSQGADTGMCASGVHYVCHYADCEHEVMPVESGYRLSAVYSLCYMGSGPKPTVDDQEIQDSVGVQELRQTIQRLPTGSLMVLPLDHQYTTWSVSHMGVAALKGADRSRYNRLAAAADKSLDFFIVFVERTDTEMGNGSYYEGFEVWDTKTGTVEITNVFNVCNLNGACLDGGVANLPTNKGIFFSQLAKYCGGELLEELFGEGDLGEVQYTGNEGATRETTYHCSALVAYWVGRNRLGNGNPGQHTLY